MTVIVPAGLWASIDATLDNSVSMAHVDGDADIYEPGQRLRDAGWAALRAAPETNNLGWPSDDYQLAVTAAREDWTFALAQLARWEPHAGPEDGWFYGPARRAIESALL